MLIQMFRRILPGFTLLLLCLPSLRGNAAPWLPYGPDGGDARAFAVDPTDHTHLYLGTLNGWIYETHDSGGKWRRLARVGKRDDLALDNIVVDAANPKHVLVGAWVLDHEDGGLFQSFDAGRTWQGTPDMAGQSIRSLTDAPSNPKILVAGTLKGVFRSLDSGAHWTLISPPENKEIHEVESVAIDPLDPNTIYAGTWHLPWKTTDAGANWASIKQGLIEDSDVFSIIVDPKDPKVVFASACSGIYKSEDAGDKFHKVQGIPSTARRTRVLMQDPEHLDTVFAGTTEGLWRTEDSGKSWSRTTGPEVIVNDVFVDPTDSKRVLLATDRGGVLTSDDGGNSFAPSNAGFSARQITAFLSDPHKPGTLYAGVVNDKEWGGVFVSPEGGLTGAQQSDGLNGRDIFSLDLAPDGTLLAGTGHGIFRLQGVAWVRSRDALLPAKAADAADAALPANVRRTPVRRGGAPSDSAVRSTSASVHRRASAAKKVTRVKGMSKPQIASARKTVAVVLPRGSGEQAVAAGKGFNGMIYSMITVGDKVFAGSSRGMLVSDTSGDTWQPLASMPGDDWRYLAAAKRTIVAASLSTIMLSADAGETWKEVGLPSKITQVSAVAVDDRGEVWVGGREGVFLSSDKGTSWQTLRNLYVRNVYSLYFDEASNQVLVTANGTATIAFAVQVADRKVSFWDTGWNLRFLRPVGDHLLGATLYDGVVIQPRMVDSQAAAPSDAALAHGTASR
jgi:photosystem II stability/assembly factor-like uncharacterized protein